MRWTLIALTISAVLSTTWSCSAECRGGYPGGGYPTPQGYGAGYSYAGYFDRMPQPQMMAYGGWPDRLPGRGGYGRGPILISEQYFDQFGRPLGPPIRYNPLPWERGGYGGWDRSPPYHPSIQMDYGGNGYPPRMPPARGGYGGYGCAPGGG